MSVSAVVKNTFICVIEEDQEEASMSSERRGRAKTVDPAILSKLVPVEELEEDEEYDDELEVVKAKSAPAALEVSQRIAGLAAGLDAGGAAAAAALEEIGHSMQELAFDACGASLLVHALGTARPSEVQALARGLRGWVGRAARSSSASRVLEQVVCSVGEADAAFIAEELLAEWPSRLALNANGSAILCRLLEYSGAAGRVVALVDAVLSADVAVLCGHKFGHEVAMSILSNGTSCQRRRILAALASNMKRFARHRFSSKVLLQALELSQGSELDSLTSVLLARPGEVLALACHKFGVNIVRELSQVPEVSEQVRSTLAKSIAKMSRDKFGSQLIRDLALGQQEPMKVSLACLLDVALVPAHEQVPTGLPICVA